MVPEIIVMVRGVWVPSGKSLLIISIYAPQELSEKRMLWDYLRLTICNWDGDVVAIGDFNEVRDRSERFGSVFNKQGAKVFNDFIANAGLVEVPLGGCSFTWCHKSASKMSKLDRFLISDSLLFACPSISSVSLDRYLSYHRPILMSESHYDYGPTPFKFYHYWFEFDGFDKFVEDSWKEIRVTDMNDYVNFMKKLRILKDKIKTWIRSYKEHTYGRMKLEKMEATQKAKIKWAVEGDENSKYYHGVINKKRGNLAIRGVLVDGNWVESPSFVKNAFYDHFKCRFEQPCMNGILLDREFTNRISSDQAVDLESVVSKEEIKRAVYDCGIDKSPGPDGFMFSFYRRYWSLIEGDVVNAVTWFFHHGRIPNGGNSSFITLIPKIPNVNMVKDFRPISLIGSVYKIVAKVLVNRLVMVLGDLVSDTQSAFVKDRQILDGPFILNELVQWCKNKRKQSMIFKVDFEKPYDSVRWDFIDTILKKFGFRDKWCNWTGSFLQSSRGSVLVNGSPTSEFQFFKGQWNRANIDTITRVLHVFHRASGLRINMNKSKLMGISVESSKVEQAVEKIGCMALKMPFKYIGSKNDAWRGDVVFKDLMPRLYMIENMKVVQVATKLSHEDLEWSFRRKLRSGVEQHRLIMLQEKIEVDDVYLPRGSVKTRWIKEVPLMINIHAWKVTNDYLPTRFNLSRRGMDIKTIVCPMCNSMVESSRHLFFSWEFSNEIMRKIMRWWELDYREINSYEAWVEWILSIRFSSNLKKVFEGTWFIVWWFIWNWHNQLLFGQDSRLKSLVFDDIVSRSFYWIRSRCKAKFSWIDWLKNHNLITLSNFARCLIEVKVHEVLKHSITMVNKRKSGKTGYNNINRNGVNVGKATWQLFKPKVGFEPKAHGNSPKNRAPNVSTSTKDSLCIVHTSLNNQPAKAVDTHSFSYTSVATRNEVPKASTSSSNILVSNSYDLLLQEFDPENYTRSGGEPNSTQDDMETEEEIEEELTRILLWVKLHDVPLQVFSDDGISLIASQIDYEWKSPRCEQCKIFDHVYDQCPKNATVIPAVDMNNDTFQTMVNKRKSGKNGYNNINRNGVNVGKATWQPIKPKVGFEPKALCNSPKNRAPNVSTSTKNSLCIVHTSLKNQPAKAVDIHSSSYTSVATWNEVPKASTSSSNIPASNSYDLLLQEFDPENYTRSGGEPNSTQNDMESEEEIEVVL
nr:RNA-directed DNA polymerase, eukaryota [Tanacetum cinerariifolium]